MSAGLRHQQRFLVADEVAKLMVFHRIPTYVSVASDEAHAPGQCDPTMEEWKKKAQRETGFGMDIKPCDMAYTCEARPTPIFE